ncbi:hypothetical protein EWU23_00440 [Cytophagaceae bacterium 50C-KIRBA]|uniref:Uncharacterized protein n=1 Tax=Aquirufa beregesia TaxID=2516556 RepID=A0ABX0ESF5_9BACT|nr:hypothetical protein [Aquirufa beregesia]NGZ42938.1 hypothetical protein [Aquirufa beregesia]
MNTIDAAMIAILEKRLELSKLNYSDESYDDVEEILHDLEDDFNEKYGDQLEEILEKVHIKHCPESDVLLPTAYLAKKFVETEDGEIEIGKKEGVEVEWIENPSVGARLVLLPSPTRILLMTPKGISVVWEKES